MPTGYTAAIADGIDFKTFALQCARAMGACIMQRDEAISPKLVNDKPTDYHKKAIADAKKRLAEFQAMSKSKIAKAHYAVLKVTKKDAEKRMAENKKLESAYGVMLANVDAWEPPTKEHAGLKKFMREQITESIRFDCGGDYYIQEVQKLEQLGPGGWHENAIASAVRDIEYHQKADAEEIERCNQRNEWKRQLLESLK